MFNLYLNCPFISIYQLRSYKLRESVQRRAVNVTLWDTMGFEGRYGPSLRDIDYILDGHIKDGYTVI